MILGTLLDELERQNKKTRFSNALCRRWYGYCHHY
ncbi:hypothetical protein M1S32_02970 [Acinetobacter baumannii]|nr:hypothetical protein M1S32_02970 [Acinetobacter baumannii]